MDNLITFFLNFKYLKKIILDELKVLNAQRLLNKKINQFVVDKQILNTKANTDLLEKYKKICEKIMRLYHTMYIFIIKYDSIFNNKSHQW